MKQQAMSKMSMWAWPMRQNITLKFITEWLGCILSLIGATLLALKCDYSGWGWIFFLVSNGLWIVYGVVTRARGLVLMQLGFTVTSALGAMNWLLK